MPATDELGKWGEELIAQWIPTKGGKVLAQRWHCVLGEIDVIALNAQGELIFIEVKTRSPRNIDQDGVLSVTRSKQIKLWKTAQMFLLKHPKTSPPQLPLRHRPSPVPAALISQLNNLHNPQKQTSQWVH
jgi:uncharacterized protein (TIGR00252 family)